MIVDKVIVGSPAYRYLDTVVRGTTQRWKDLVLLLNTVDQELSNVLIKWQVHVILDNSGCVHLYMYMHMYMYMYIREYSTCIYLYSRYI